MAIIADIYCRVSTDAQEENTSFEEQESSGRDYCRSHGLAVGNVYHETYSGFYYRERQHLTTMRERYREGIIQGVVVRNLDRLSRSQVHSAVLMEEMQHYGVTLHCVKEKIDDTAMGQLVRMILAAVAEMEREKIIDRTLTGRVNAVKAGKVAVGKNPRYGWTWHDAAEKDYLVRDMQPASVIRWASYFYARGVSCFTLVKRLEEKRIPPPRGEGQWVVRTLRRLLTDERNTGRAKAFTTQTKTAKQNIEPLELPEGTYPRLVPEATFQRCLMRASINREESGRNGSNPENYLLRAGFIRCAVCNHAMVGRELHDRQYSWHIYECVRHAKCPGHRVKATELDTHVWQDLVRLADHIPLLEQAIRLATSTDTIEANLRAVTASLATWKDQAAAYTADLQDKGLRGTTRASILKLLDEANGMVEQLESERAQIAAGAYNKAREREAYEEILTWCRKVKEAREELTCQQKRDFLRMLGVTVLVEKRNRNYEEMAYDIRVGLPSIQDVIYQQSGAIVGHHSSIMSYNTYFVGINKAGFYINPALLSA